MLTALRDEDSRDRANLVGADEYFVKPFSPLALVSRLQELLPAGAESGPAPAATLVQTGTLGSTTTLTAPEAQKLVAYARDLNQSLEQLRRVCFELERSYLQTVEALAAALDARDSATEGHCQRLTGRTLIIGEQLGLQRAEMTALH
jgi:response regulator RpfG family c-di-GMP phosphodiesterase